MKTILISLFILSFSNQVLADASHGNNSFVIEAQDDSTTTAGQFAYLFKLVDSHSGKTIGDSELVESHTKKLHLVIYDKALKEFTHTHPSFDGKNWIADLELNKNGRYFVWAQGELANGAELLTSTRLDIINGLPENPIEPIGDVRSSQDSETMVELSKNSVKVGKMVMLDFSVKRTDGIAPILSPYLGAFAHVIAVSPNGQNLIHVHPMEGTKANTGMLHATFPTTGEYRLWLQIIDHDELKTIPLSIRVEK